MALHGCIHEAGGTVAESCTLPGKGRSGTWSLNSSVRQPPKQRGRQETDIHARAPRAQCPITARSGERQRRWWWYRDSQNNPHSQNTSATRRLTQNPAAKTRATSGRPYTAQDCRHESQCAAARRAPAYRKMRPVPHSAAHKEPPHTRDH